MTLLDQPWQLELFHVMQIKYALRIEVRTGLRHSRGSVLALANDLLVQHRVITKPFARKGACLERLDEYILGLETCAYLDLESPR